MNVKCIHHFLISGKVLYAFDHSSDALSWYLAEIMDREVGDLLFFCFCHNGAAKWMLRKFSREAAICKSRVFGMSGSQTRSVILVHPG